MENMTEDVEEIRRQLRQAFGCFATGVTVVTARDADHNPIGFTANSFTSVSIDPPLLLVCLAKTSSNIAHFSRRKRFAVNILSEMQKDVSNRFASRIENRFADVDWRKGSDGIPLINDAVAWFDCATDKLVNAGDHIILIGRIFEFGHSDRHPLAYLRGRYLDFGLVEEAIDSVSHHGGALVGCVLETRGRVLLQKTSDGWILPMGDSCGGLREGRGALEKWLADQGIAADLGFLYSVFDAPSGNATWLIFQGEIRHGQANGSLRLFPVDNLPFHEVAVPQIKSVLRRFQSEFQQSRFGLYVDGTNNEGQINPIDREATPWSKFVSEQGYSA